MVTSEKTPRNAQHAAFPSLFKRTGEARRIKGFRASRETFNRAMRLAKALDSSPRLIVHTPIGALVLSERATETLKEDGGIASLLLNGFSVVPAGNIALTADVDAFLSERDLLVAQLDMFSDDDDGAEHLGKGSR